MSATYDTQFPTSHSLHCVCPLAKQSIKYVYDFSRKVVSESYELYKYTLGETCRRIEY
jgi:hypothetical protein